MNLERSPEMSVSGAATIIGTPLVMEKMPSVATLKAITEVVKYNFGYVDDLVDYECRKCKLRDICKGPVDCLIEPMVPANIAKGEAKLGSFYKPEERDRVLTLARQFDVASSDYEMDAIKNPPVNEAGVRKYRESVLWVWAEIYAGLREGSKITNLTEPLVLPDEIGETDRNNILRIFYAGAYFQAVSDHAKHHFHLSAGIPGYGSTIEDKEARSEYCQELQTFYANKAIEAGVHPTVLKVFNFGFNSIHHIRRLLPAAVQDNTLFTT